MITGAFVAIGRCFRMRWFRSRLAHAQPGFGCCMANFLEALGLYSRLMLFANSLGQRAAVTVPFHLVGDPWNPHLRLAVDALRLKCSMIDARLHVRIPQG